MPKTPSFFAVTAIAAALLAVGAPARADDTEREVAAQFFEAGQAAAKRGEYRVCAEAFTEANKRAPVGATIYNAGLCWQNANDLPRAANDYKEALRLGLSGSQADQAKKRLADLKSKLGQIEVTDPRGQRGGVGPIKQQLIPFSTFVLPGDSEVRVEGPDGEIVTKTVHVAAGASKSVGLELDSSDKDGSERPVPTPAPEPAQEPSSFARIQTPLGWTLIGVSVVAAGAGALFWSSALSAKDAYDNPPHSQDDKDRALSRARTADILWVGAGVGAAAGIALVVTAPKSSRAAQPAPEASLSLRLRPAGASVLWRF